VPISESTRRVTLHLAASGRSLVGWEAACVDVRDTLSSDLFAAALTAHQEALVVAACGERYRPRGRWGVLGCPRCGARAGFRRRGHRRRRLFTRVGRIEVRLAMLGCRCGHRFAPLLAMLGVRPARRVAPGFERRALALCTELPYRRAAQALRREAGAGPSERTLRRLVRAAAAQCDLRAPRRDLAALEAVLVDGTRVRAGPKKRARDDRGIELDIALALCGHDAAGQAQLELLGVTLDRGWPSLIRPLRAAAGAPIAIHDGDAGISRILDRALPEVPQQICTFHLRSSFDHRLWQDGLALAPRRALARAWGNALEYAVDATDAADALAAMRTMAERHRWRRTAFHLRAITPNATTWLRIGAAAHTTSLLERVMREVNRRVDPVGVRWSRDGAAALIDLLLARRFAHPDWRRLCNDAGSVQIWAELQ
jgi:Transposase, Mutator family